MDKVNFIQQIHNVFLMPRALGSIEYKQRVNWDSDSTLKRERANLMFSRIQQGLYNIANDLANFNVAYDSATNCFKYTFTDNFGYFLFSTRVDSNGNLFLFVEDFVFTYKDDKTSWWSIVDTKQSGPFPFLTKLLRIISTSC